MSDDSPKDKSLWSKLTKLFRGGAIVQRKVKQHNLSPLSSTEKDSFKKSVSNMYGNVISNYASADRMSRLADASEMDGASPEISTALDIFAEETASPDDKGVILHVNSDNRQIQDILEELFYDVINTEFNLAMWTRNLVKFGDFFLYLDIDPEYGITSVHPIGITDIDREEAFDVEEPNAVRFKWVNNGNMILENWQVAHFRLLGNDSYIPYGSSVIDGARRIFKQLTLLEDAMLVYRIVRAPERRVFYIDVGNIAPDQVDNYLEQTKSALKRQDVVDRTTGEIDKRYNPLSVTEDYFIPRRGTDSGTQIDTLKGGENTAAIDDVKYLQSKLFAALKIPKAYFGYEEGVGSKATLAFLDIRFSRSIQRIQKVILSELNKIAMIHLYVHGFRNEDLIDFNLQLSNPSSIAQQQKLELFRTKFEIAQAALQTEGIVNRDWIRREILGLTDQNVVDIKKGLLDDVKFTQALAPEEGGDGEGFEGGGGDDFGGGEDELFAHDEKTGQLITSMEESDSLIDPDDIDIEDEPAPPKKKRKHGVPPLLIDDDEDELYHGVGELSDDEKRSLLSLIKPDNKVSIPSSRKKTHGPAKSHMPDFKSIVGVGKSTRQQDSMNQPYDGTYIKNPFRSKLKFESGEISDPPEETDGTGSVGSLRHKNRTTQHAVLNRTMKDMLGEMEGAVLASSSELLSESKRLEEEIEIEELELEILEEDEADEVV